MCSSYRTALDYYNLHSYLAVGRSRQLDKRLRWQGLATGTQRFPPRMLIAAPKTHCEPQVHLYTLIFLLKVIR